jgi:D-glycero-alpha-D-manno-heptose 1-phosphate guanylyltransferase
MECIILAGGFGTRLQAVVNDVPKCMAPIAGNPFLYWLTKHLQTQGVTTFIFSVGYKKESIINWAAAHFTQEQYTICAEDEPLGTGGAIKKALTYAKTPNVLAVNGDTFYDGAIQSIIEEHIKQQALCTLGLQTMHFFERYGNVVTHNNCITSFEEKQFVSKGQINTGTYIINKDAFIALPLPEKFSFEIDFLAAYVHTGKLYGIVNDGYFIDIGIPEDYNIANQHFLSLGQ